MGPIAPIEAAVDMSVIQAFSHIRHPMEGHDVSLVLRSLA